MLLATEQHVRSRQGAGIVCVHAAYRDNLLIIHILNDKYVPEKKEAHSRAKWVTSFLPSVSDPR